MRRIAPVFGCVGSTETNVQAHYTTRRRISEYYNVNTDRRENLQFQWRVRYDVSNVVDL